jgi:hypothetical protein
MDPKHQEPRGKLAELLAKRQELHGKRRQLHESLAEVCEDFVLSDINRPHKQTALVRELQYLLDYYNDEASWEGIH